MREIQCRGCGHLLRVGDSASRIRCPGCGKIYDVRRGTKGAPRARKGSSDPREGAGSGVERSSRRRERPRPVGGPARRKSSRERVPRSHPTPENVGEGPPADGPRREDLLGVVLATAGGLMLLAAAILLVAGPVIPEGMDPEVLSSRQKDLQKRVQELQDQIGEGIRGLDKLRGEVGGEDHILKKLSEKQDRLIREERELYEKLVALAGSSGAGAPPGGTARSQSEMIRGALKSVVFVQTNLGSGSGFIISERGIAATNYHVLQGSVKLDVEVKKGDSGAREVLKEAKIVAVDPQHDLALIQLPAAPESVADDGRYPALQLRIDPPAIIGEDTFAIGNPGSAGGILKDTVSKGIVSDPERRLGTEALIQVSASVSPGNSGGPLLDKQGRVLGVVTLKGRDVESVTFAVAAKTLENLRRRKLEKPYRVEGGLAEWELQNEPVTALMGRNPLWRSEFELQLPGFVSRMLPSPDGERLYLAMPGVGVGEYLTQRRRLGRLFRTESWPADMALDGGSGHLFVLMISEESKKVLRLEASSLNAAGEVELTFRPRAVSVLGGGDQTLVVLSRDVAEVGAFLLAKEHFDKRGLQAWPLPYYRPGTLAFGSDQRWIAAVGKGGSGPDLQLRVLPAEHGKTLARLAKDSRRRRKLKSSQAERLRSKESSASLPRRRVPEENLFLPVPAIHFAGPDKLIYGRHLFGLNRNLSREEDFEKCPLRLPAQAPPEISILLDNILSVSSDGRWAASGSHVYDVSSQNIVKQLPTLALHLAFSRDGKSLYLVDYRSRYLYAVLDWGKSR